MIQYQTYHDEALHIHKTIGAITKATIEPTETYLKIWTIIAHIINTITPENQLSANSIPNPIETDFPPLPFKKHDLL